MAEIKKVNVGGNNYDIIDAVSTWTVAGLTRNLSNAGGSTSSEITAEQLRTALGLTNAMHFIGITTTNIQDGDDTTPITIGGNDVTPVAGDVVIRDNSAAEFVWDGSHWNLMGDTGDFALKITTITGTGALGGGGNLESNQQITHNTYTVQNSNNTSGQAQAVLNIVSDGYGHVTSVTSGTIAARFTGTEATITSTASYKPAGTNTASAVSFTAHTTDSVLGADTGFTTTVTPATTNIAASASGTAVTLSSSKFLKTASGTTKNLGTTSITGVDGTETVSVITANTTGTAASFQQGTFSAGTLPSIDKTKFSGGSYSHSEFSGGSFQQGTDSFTANTPTAIDVTKFNAGTLPTTTDSTWAFTVTDGTLNISGENSRSSAGELPSLGNGFYTAGTAASFHQGTDNFTAATYGTDNFTAASIGDDFFSAGTLPSHSADTFVANTPTSITAEDKTVAKAALAATTVATGSLVASGGGDSVVYTVATTDDNAATGVQSVTDPTIALSTNATAGTGVISVATGITSSTTTAGTTDLVNAITALGTGTAAAQTFTGTQATISSTASYTPAGNISVTVTAPAAG